MSLLLIACTLLTFASCVSDKPKQDTPIEEGINDREWYDNVEEGLDLGG